MILGVGPARATEPPAPEAAVVNPAEASPADSFSDPDEGQHEGQREDGPSSAASEAPAEEGRTDASVEPLADLVEREDDGNDTTADVRTDETGDGDELAFDRISLAEIEAMGQRTFETTEEPPEPYMRPEGVHDPFRDRVARTRLHNVVVPLALSFSLAGAGATMAHLALNPDCDDVTEVASCSIPNGADIGVRGGRAVAAVGFGVGGVVFGVLGGRELGHRLQQNTRLHLEQRRRIAVGLGTTSVVLGTAGIVVGGVFLANGIRGARSVGEDALDTETVDEALPLGDAALGHVTSARVGFMLLASTPALIGMGASLLAHRPRRSRVSLSPNVSPTYAGITLRGRF